MRYIGSKQRLLDRIVRLARQRGVPQGGVVVDVFAGTAAVGRRFKEEGFRVLANDRMRLSYVLQRALVVADAAPADLAHRVAALEGAPRRRPGFVTRVYSPLGDAGRMFFHPDQALAIDAALALLKRWRRAGDIGEDAFYVLLAGVLEGASGVANISGTYGAYLKSWQPNALAPLRVRVTPPVPSRAGPCGASCDDANAFAGEHAADLLYIDPPYNRREYCANYHVLEAIAEVALAARPAAVRAIEARVYGKTGLLPYERSRFCSPRKVLAAFEDMVRRCRADHVIFSYSEEGLMAAGDIRCALARGLGCDEASVRHEQIAFKRFRSDTDRAGDGASGSARRYRQLEGRGRDGLCEWLFHAARPKAAAAATAADVGAAGRRTRGRRSARA